VIKILALDLSYVALGLAHTHQLDGPAVGVRTITPGARRGDERMDYLIGEVREQFRWQPQLCVKEGLFVGQVNNTLQLAKLHGVIERELWLHEIVYVDVAPGTLKVYANGDGKADKAAVLHAIRGRYADALGGPSRIRTNDDADAVTLLAMARHAYGQPLAPVPAECARALRSVQWPILGGSTSPVALDFASIAPPTGALL